MAVSWTFLSAAAPVVKENFESTAVEIGRMNG